MFRLLAIVVVFGSGQPQMPPLMNPDDTYKTFEACAKAVPARLAMFKKELSRDRKTDFIAFTCLKAPKPGQEARADR
jgi:hypothetical protein